MVDRFPVVLRGYDKEKVDAAFDATQESMKRAQQTLASMREQIAADDDRILQLQAQLQEEKNKKPEGNSFASLGANAQQMLASAEQTSTELLERAKQDASSIRTTAQAQAETLINNAKLDAQHIVDDANAKAASILTNASNQAESVTTSANEDAAQLRSETAKTITEQRQTVELELSNAREEHTKKMASERSTQEREIADMKAEATQQDLYRASAMQLKEEIQNMDGGIGENRIQILAGLTRLRQICCDPALCYTNYRGASAKLDTCVELIQGGIAGGHKILLFSQFTSMLERIAMRLTKEGISYHMLTGATPKEERIRLAGAFQSDEVPIFLISLKAGGTGLNLTSADIVIHYDPWWNVAAQNQATDRTHRIGQEKQVSVFKLIMKDTIEESILKLQEQKQDLARQVIEGETLSLTSLSREELLKLLS